MDSNDVARMVVGTLVVSLAACDPELPDGPAERQDETASLVRLFDVAEIGTGVELWYPRLSVSGADITASGTIWDLGSEPRPDDVSLATVESTGVRVEPQAALLRPLTMRHRGTVHLRVQGKALGQDARIVVWGLRRPLEGLAGTRTPQRFFKKLERRILDTPWPIDVGEHGEAQIELPLLGSDRHLLIALQSGGGLEVSKLVVEEGCVDLPTATFVGGDLRRAVPIAVDTKLRLAVPSNLADDSELRFGLSWPDEGVGIDGPIRIKVHADESLVHEVLLAAEEYPWARHWTDVRIPWPAAATSLSLAVEAEQPGMVLWAEPVWVEARSTPPVNVILISIDTLRPDRLGCEGNPRGLSPHLDALAARGCRMTRMYSNSNYTLPGHASMFTGRLSSVLGIGGTTTRGQIGGVATLATQLAKAGYTTAAFTGGGFVDPAFGFGQGFDRYSVLDPMMLPHEPLWARGPRRENPDWNHAVREAVGLDTALDWIRHQSDNPFLAFVHTYHVHEYSPSDEAIERFAPDTGSDLGRGAWSKRTSAWFQALERGSVDLEHLERYYDATVWDVDRMLGRLFEVLDEMGLTERTVIAVTSDHGESFHEHGRFGHGHGLYEELIRVPWLLAGPGVPSGTTIDRPVSLADVTPTLLDLAGGEPIAVTEGESLVSWFGAESVESRAVYAVDRHGEEDGTRTRIEDQYKLLARHQGDELRWLLFDLETDPGETDDLSNRSPEQLRRIRAQFEADTERFRQLEKALGAHRATELDPRVAEELEALGYVVR